jgi:Fe-S cluster assembly ATP-binding protein
MLTLKSVSVLVEDIAVVSDVSLKIESGTVHVCMGQNGSGKSSLVSAIAGHPFYTITSGQIFLDTKDIRELSPDKKAKAGIFLSQQYPQSLPGVTVYSLLKESYRALHPDADQVDLPKKIAQARSILKLDESFLWRNTNEGFSGGEKKRCEMLQLLVLKPKIALLDEIDSGLDVDALKSVGKALSVFIKDNPQSSLFLITHYQKILDYIKPDVVHIMHKGRLVQSSDATLITKVQESGYDQFNA